MDKIIWKPVPGYEALYEVSNAGDVRNTEYLSSRTNCIISRPVPRVLRQETSHDGYKRVVLSNNGKHRHFSVHRLVAMAFVPNPNNMPQINHIDENPANNRADNLEWCNGKQNCNHGGHCQRIAIRQTNNPSRSKPVRQLDMDGNFIKEYPSTREAERQTGVACEQISRCCKGRNHHAGGCRWEYANLKTSAYG